MAASGSLVKWYTKDILRSDDPAILKKLDREAEEIPPAADGVIVLPYFLGEKTPLFDPEARGVIYGLTLSHSRAHVFRAILESVVYGFRHHIDELTEMGYRPQQIIATDGGVKSPLWCQIAADILNAPVRAYPSHPGSALGVAFTAGMAVGVFSHWEEIRGFLTDYRNYTPNPEAAAIYDKAYKIYRGLYPALREANRKLGTLYDR
jgi:xylulokinase